MPKIRFDQLTDSQRKAVFHIDGPLLVLAGPGSGKTRVITYRIAALVDAGVRPYNILAITFTNKAAEEMRQRAEALGNSRGSHISTFHSLCVRILRQYASDARIGANFTIYDAADQKRCIKRAIKECELESSSFTPARMLNAISALKNNLEDVQTFKLVTDDFFSKKLALVYERYQDILAELNGLDFDDLLMKTAFLLRDKPHIRSQIAERFKYLLVDEYQDTNQAQYKIAKSIASEHHNICVTGDPDQSIYRWRGADIRNILAFEKDWPDAAVVRLEENFRSTPNILQAADNLIANNKNRKQKMLIPTRAAGKNVRINAFEDEQSEALSIAEQIEQLSEQGSSLRNFAVFYRINAASRVLEEALIKKKIPYQIVRGVEFYSRKEIRDTLAYLKILVNPDDRIALLRIINTPTRGIGKTTIDRLADYAQQNNISLYQACKRSANVQSLSKTSKAKIAVFVNMIESFKKNTAGKVAPLVESVFVETGMKSSLQVLDSDDKSRLENVSELINAASQYDQLAEEPSLLDYLQQISLFSDTDSYDTSVDRVALMTLHAAKGLEFDNVFIVGAEEGLLPHERSLDDEEQTEEERRLLFVGITRAKTELDISYAKYRTTRNQMRRTIPSSFLYELGVDLPRQEQSYTIVPEKPDTLETAVDGVYLDTEDYMPEFTRGELVAHRKFGLGRVVKFNYNGIQSTVIVKFNTGQTKTLMVQYAKLLKML